MRERMTTGGPLIAVAVGLLALLVLPACGSAQADPLQVTYYYLPG